MDQIWYPCSAALRGGCPDPSRAGPSPVPTLPLRITGCPKRPELLRAHTCVRNPGISLYLITRNRLGRLGRLGRLNAINDLAVPSHTATLGQLGTGGAA